MADSPTPEPGTERTLRKSARNPKRRQRVSDGESLKTLPRRKRSKLSEDTFAPRETTEVHDPVVDDDAVQEMNGHPRGGRGRRKESTPALDGGRNGELVVRGGRKTGTGTGTGTLKHKPLKGDGSTVLTSNKLYNVKLLPSTPRELRAKDLEYSGSLLSTGDGRHLALAVTRQKAYVWDYQAHTAVSNARVFDAPFHVRAGDALPVGALVPGAVGSEVGLVLVSATGGKIIFYDSIDRAATLGLFQDRKPGIEGLISGYSSSETVLNLLPADHAGFILTLSSGRILQLTLRDTQGKARVFTRPLRPDEPNAGLFGSLKGFLGGAWKRDVVAVKTRELDKRGRMQVVSLTESCAMQMWELEWSGQYAFRGSLEFRELIGKEVRSLGLIEQQGVMESVAALDFVIVDNKPFGGAKGNELVTPVAEQPMSLWVLVRVGTADMQQYVLVEMSVLGYDAKIERTLKVDSYHGQSTRHAPKLLLPKPGHTAYIVFEDAVVLMAATEAEVADDPNAQLHEASYIQPQNFEDAVYLKTGGGLAITGAEAEDHKSGHTSAIAFIQGAGLVRTSATDPVGDVERERLPAKSKIEQAVFYGALQEGNILDFLRKSENPYTIEEVEEATLTISEEILRSDSSFLSASPTSMEANLEYRARAMKALVEHVVSNFPPLERGVMWRLLSTSEKLASAQQLLAAFTEHKAASEAARGKRVQTAMDMLCDNLANRGDVQLPELEDDREDNLARRFFVKGVPLIDKLLANIRVVLDAVVKAKLPPEEVVRLTAEADELWLRAVEAAFSFRLENAGAFGIDPDSRTSELSEPWTCSDNMLKTSREIPAQSRDVAKLCAETEEESDAIINSVKQITERLPGILKLCCTIFQERINWQLSQDSDKAKAVGEELKRRYVEERHEQFRGLAGIGLAKEGMDLAERYRDMQTLTVLIVGESQYYASELSNPTLTPSQRAVCADMMEKMTGKISHLFTKFGDEWANAFFDEAFSGSRAGNMLGEAQTHWREALTRYLRADNARAKICWIHDVGNERDYGHAGHVLMKAALEEQNVVWPKKVELSMAKLALMAAKEGGGEQPAYIDEQLRRPNRELELVDIQERLFRHVNAESLASLDHEAKVELAMEKLGQSNTKDYNALQEVLMALIDRLLHHLALSVEELIDTLTLMDSRMYEHESEKPEANLDGQEILMALRVLDAAAPGLEQGKFEMLLQLIWKRCYTADDWGSITSTKAGKGGAESERQTRLRGTATWRTLFHLHNTAFLTRPDCNIRPLAPSECLGAACDASDILYRFHHDHELVTPIILDNRLQDELLQSYIVDRRLGEWVQECEQDARKVVEEKAEQEASVREREREMVGNILGGRWIEGVGVGNGYMNGAVKGVHGVVGVEVDGEEEVVVVDGDVEME